MAASSSKSVFAPKEYDVFISFRGDDTRHNFISHLFPALERKSIKAYIDYELNKGDEISASLIKAIEDSYGSLVVFSENYASSKWCLNELLQILECRKRGHFVIPVFYNIDPSHVRKQTASYGEAFAIHEQDSRHKDKLQLWKTALSEAANIACWDSRSRTNRDEYELIQNIVDDILQKMNYIRQPSESSFVGIDKYCKEIESLLERLPFVGIWGMSGMGKTTIAKVVFRKFFSQYDSYYFFENVREKSNKNVLNYICNTLLSELLKKNFHSNTPNTSILKFAMRRLCNKKVLIVLDDVNSRSQLENLQEVLKCLGVNSKVIITTRDKHVLTSLAAVDHAMWEVEGLNFQDSSVLFCLKAFTKDYPEIGYEDITYQFVHYAKGIPLALNVLGSFLHCKSKEDWESVLRKLKKFPHDDILQLLRLSYDKLDYERQQIFLHVACFLKGEHFENAMSFLDSCGFSGRTRIRSLQDKALVTIGYDHCVHVHDLIEQMGWYIVRSESSLHWMKSLIPIRYKVWKLLIHPNFWRVVGFVSSAAGLLCFALSFSFQLLFGKWNIWKIFLYGAVSFIITGFMLLPKTWQLSRRTWLTVLVLFLVFVLTSLGSFFYEKKTSGKPDRLGLSSVGLFSLSSLSLSRQIDIGFEVGFTNFLLGTFTVQIMQIHEDLVCLPAAIYFAMVVVRSYLESRVKGTATRSIEERVGEETTTGSIQEHVEEAAPGSIKEHVVNIQSDAQE